MKTSREQKIKNLRHDNGSRRPRFACPTRQPVGRIPGLVCAVVACGKPGVVPYGVVCRFWNKTVAPPSTAPA